MPAGIPPLVFMSKAMGLLTLARLLLMVSVPPPPPTW